MENSTQNDLKSPKEEKGAPPDVRREAMKNKKSLSSDTHSENIAADKGLLKSLKMEEGDWITRAFLEEIDFIPNR